MNNIRQITNFDLEGASEVSKTILVGGDKGKIITDCPYLVITQEMLGSGDIFKFGYCVNNNIGLGYPIFLGINGNEPIEFQIGKTGMFEFQPEEWVDENDPEDTELKTMQVSLTSVLVPKQSWKDEDESLYGKPIPIPFVIDYCYTVGS